MTDLLSHDISSVILVVVVISIIFIITTTTSYENNNKNMLRLPWDSHPEPSAWQPTMLTTTPLCDPNRLMFRRMSYSSVAQW